MGGLELGSDLCQSFVDQFLEERVLVGEVEVEGACRHAGMFGDGCARDVRNPPDGEQFCRSGQEFQTRLEAPGCVPVDCWLPVDREL